LASLWSSITGRGREKAPEGGTAVMTLEDIEKSYDFVHVSDEPGRQFAVIAPKGSDTMQMAERLGSELGSSSASPWTSFSRQEYNPALQGLRGLEVYDKMRKSDGAVRGTLRSIKTGALAGKWFVTPASDSPEDREIANFIWCNLTEYMSIPFSQVIAESLLMCDFGNYMWEKVWENRLIEGEMRTVLSKLGPRHPMDVKDWKFDRNGGPLYVEMFKSTQGSGLNDSIKIPIDKLLVFTFDREAGNIEGISVLRSAYKHWYFKEQLYKIDAIQKERHGIGIPVIELPLGFKPEDKTTAEELGRNIRTNERAHITLPPGWKIYMLKLEGQPVDALKSVEHHNEQIRENILVNFVAKGAQDADLQFFNKASRIVADILADSVNHYLIPQMVAFNWPHVEKFPKLQVRRIGENADWRTLSFAIRNLIGAGVIIPDEALERNLREEMDLPPLDKDSARLIATPQNPYDINEDIDDEEEDDAEGGDTHNPNSPLYNRNRRKLRRAVKQQGARAGLPRQTLPGKQSAPFGLPRGNGGTDRSGG
jgi:hypothetical protein